MSKIMKLTKGNRGVMICSGCNQEIKCGDQYLKATPYRQKPIIRCVKCGLQPYETSNSNYIRQVGRLKDYWRSRVQVDADDVQGLIDDINSLKDDVEYSLYNMPEQFQDGSVLRERLDALEMCIDELESIDIEEDYEDEDDDEQEDYYIMIPNNYKSDVLSALSNL